MTQRTRRYMWLTWLILAIGIATFYANQMFVQAQKPELLIGETSYGHYQIELQCTACHESAFGGQDVLQNACISCHGQELKEAQDSHPKSKFTDPRNIDRLEKVDARYCVSCHTEHNPDLMRPMGVSLPEDFCFHCHQDIAQERPSHEGMEFQTCASSGCHNFHDNRALYEDFLVKHAKGKWLDMTKGIADTDIKRYVSSLTDLPEQLPAMDVPEDKLTAASSIHDDWLSSSHSAANVGCNACHGSAASWQDKPTHQVCASCHENEVSTFLQGKHGMRLANDLPAMTPNLAIQRQTHLAFNQTNHETSLTCSSCHDPHQVNVQEAKVNSCLSCHSDEHSEAFLSSPHGQTWLQFEAGQIEENQAVSCSTCHLPRMEFEHHGQQNTLVQHNQNATLRPNEKMIRTTCMSCHSLSFSIDALADPNLIQNNFSGTPSQHIPSIDMSLKRAQ
ncbi:cytochrome c3 family protein [Aliiglaciecola sp. M165]|uniref:cytochrome c3 family protein n=1 Tax=Aliiglaciecola sp. M165 TaxID=2593649 RepID=UPI00117CCF14|nr:cytochrome c3 family protein [Aliiglaciecola sp. M165]TRY29291.1 hypothetical protein FM019_17965 [Aliiglaciecola sp. M165]